MSRTTQNRRNRIYDFILEKGHIQVQDLAQEFEVTTETIRKDLNLMDQQGLIVKTHGGAMIKKSYYQLPFTAKINEHIHEKQLIARKTLELIPDYSILFIDPGTTTMYLSKFLVAKKDLTIVTNSLAIASIFSQTTHKLIFAGGSFQKQGQAMVGPFARQVIDSINFDYALMGCDGFKGSIGPTSFSLEEIDIKRHAIRQAKNKFLLCDSSKFRKSSPYIFSRWSDIDVLITNQIGPEEKNMVSDVKKIYCIKEVK